MNPILTQALMDLIRLLDGGVVVDVAFRNAMHEKQVRVHYKGVTRRFTMTENATQGPALWVDGLARLFPMGRATNTRTYCLLVVAATVLHRPDAWSSNQQLGELEHTPSGRAYKCAQEIVEDFA